MHAILTRPGTALSLRGFLRAGPGQPEKGKMYPYEAMFLVDPVMHGTDPQGVAKIVTGLLEKHGAELHDFDMWDERKLAYEIKGHKRGVYFLTRFRMPGENLVELRADCAITECILRQMIIRLEDEIPLYLEKSAAYYEKMKEDQESRRGDRHERGDFRGERDEAPARTPAPAPAPAAPTTTEAPAETPAE